MGTGTLRQMACCGVEVIMKRKDLIEILKQVNPIENDGSTAICNIGKNNKKVYISVLSVDKDFINVTIGKYLFKRKYQINKNEL